MKIPVRDYFHLSINSMDRVKALEEHLEFIRNTASGRSPEYNDKVGRCASQIVDLENKITAERIKLIQIADTAYTVIHRIAQPLRRTILEYKFIEGLTLEEIAEKTNYTPRHASRLFNKALDELESYYPEGIDIDDDVVGGGKVAWT